MGKNPLRLEQYETVRYDLNMNPLGIPQSARKAIAENIDAISHYPDIYYGDLKQSIAAYTSAPAESIVMGNGSSDLIRLFAALVAPKKAKLIQPCFSEYDRVLRSYGCEVEYYALKEEDDFAFSVMDFIASLDSSIDMIIIGNPNNPTSRKIPFEDMEALASACESLDIFLIIDEMYIEFLDNHEKYTSVPLTETYENLAVFRSISKFFALPGIRLAYAVMNNPVQMQIINMTTTTNNIPTLTAIVGAAVLKDTEYIEESRSTIHTERNLVYSAMSTSKTIKLIKPDANFMLLKILKKDVTSRDVYDHCHSRGIIIRRCDDIPGLNEKYIRFCFMNPKQNDLMVNTILEII